MKIYGNTVSSIPREVFVGTYGETTYAEFLEAYRADKLCEVKVGKAGAGYYARYVASEIGGGIAHFYCVNKDGTVGHATVTSGDVWSMTTETMSGSTFVGDETTTVAEFYEAYNAKKTCFLRNSYPGGTRTWVAYSVGQQVAYFYAIDAGGTILSGMLSSSGFDYEMLFHVESITEESKNSQIPTAKAVWDAIQKALPEESGIVFVETTSSPGGISSASLTYAEIYEAYTAGVPVLISPLNRLHICVSADPSGAEFVPVSVFGYGNTPAGKVYYKYTVSPGNVWTRETVELPFVTTELSESSSDNYLPTAKAVWTALSSKLSEDDLGTAVNSALAQAKESGEFDGKTPVKGTDYFTAADKAEMVRDVIAALPVYSGEVESV